MADAFAIFDSPNAIVIEHLKRTAVAGRSTAGAIFAPEGFATAVRIRASLDRTIGLGQQNKSNIARDVHNNDGIDLSGEMRLYTTGARWDNASPEQELNIGDRIKVTFANIAAGSTNRNVKTFRIRGVVADYGWLEQFTPGTVGRQEWAIVLEDSPERPI